MKRTMITLVATMLLIAGSTLNVSAQQKIGHINSNELISTMPERDSAMQMVEAKRQDFVRQSEELTVEFNKKYEAYVSKADSLTNLIRQTKEAELNDLRNRIETFNAAADQELQKYNQEVFQPIIDKAQKAVQDVAKENGFTYILDTSTGAVVFFPEEGNEDIMPLVKKKLGIQ